MPWCQLCSLGFETVRVLKKHLDLSHPTKPTQEDACGNNRSEVIVPVILKKTTDEPQEEIIQESECEEDTDRRIQILGQIPDHENTENFQRVIPAKTYSRKRNFYQCTVCLKTFAYLRNLRKHLKIPAAGGQPNKCQQNYCNKANNNQNGKFRPNFPVPAQKSSLKVKTQTSSPGEAQTGIYGKNRTTVNSDEEDFSGNQKGARDLLKSEPSEDEDQEKLPEDLRGKRIAAGNTKNFRRRFAVKTKSQQPKGSTVIVRKINEIYKRRGRRPKFRDSSENEAQEVMNTQEQEAMSPQETTTECKECHFNCATPEFLCLHYTAYHQRPAVRLARLKTNELKKRKKNKKNPTGGGSNKSQIASSASAANKIFKCTTCKKRFSGQANLNIHVSRAHKGTRLRCNLCHKEFKYSAGLRYHKMSAHDGIRFKCDICDREFTTSPNLRSHKLSAHNDRSDGIRIKIEC